METWLTALLVTGSAAFGLVVGAWTKFLDSAAKRRAVEAAASVADYAAAVNEYKAILDRQVMQIARLEKQVEDQHAVIIRQMEIAAGARETMQNLYGLLRMIHATASRQNAAIASLGGVMEPVLDLPELRLGRLEEHEVTAKEAATNAILSKELSGIRLGQTKTPEPEKGP